MEQWRAAELARQGGKFGSHGWWPWGLAAFDYDNDGDLDLVAQHHGAPRSMILRNLLEGEGHAGVRECQPELGLPSNALAGATSRWSGLRRDGFLDMAYRDSQRDTFFFNRRARASRPCAPAGRGPRNAPPEEVDDAGSPACARTPPATRSRAPRASSRVSPGSPAGMPSRRGHSLPRRRGQEDQPLLPRQVFRGHRARREGPPGPRLGRLRPLRRQCLGRYLIADKEGGFADATERLGLPRTARQSTSPTSTAMAWTTCWLRTAAAPASISATARARSPSARPAHRLPALE